MPNLIWSGLTSQQIGRYAEYFSKMEFASCGLEIYTSEVDDHGIDFVVKSKAGFFWEVQVKSYRSSRTNYIFMQEEKFDITQQNLLLHLLSFTDGAFPKSYIIPSIEWQKTNELLCHMKYEGLKSKPEFGIRLSKKNIDLLDQYSFETMILKVLA